jgi:RHS repeat-associated protein
VTVDQDRPFAAEGTAGSAQAVDLGDRTWLTDKAWGLRRSQESERIEYTPYGKVWIEKRNVEANGLDIPYRFTGKERDEEMGLSSYGARYLDGKTARWLSADPALGEYLPEAPVEDEARERNGKLPGMGGVYNTINLHLYHYAGENPVKYTDPDGKDDEVPPWKAKEIELAQYMEKYLGELQLMQIAYPDPDSVATSITDRISISAEKNLGQVYSDNNQCDDWVAKVLEEAGIDSSLFFAGTTSQKTVEQHITSATGKGNSSNRPQVGANVVFMNEGKRPSYNAHAGILIVKVDGTAVFYHSSHNNPEHLSTREKPYKTIQAFQNDFAYNKFYYQPVR